MSQGPKKALAAMPLKGGQVLCVGDDAHTNPWLLPELTEASQPVQAYFAQDDALVVLALYADASFLLMDLNKDAASHRGIAELLSVDVAHLGACLQARPCCTQLVLRKRTVLGGMEFVQLLPLVEPYEPLLLRLCLPSGRVSVQRLKWPLSMSCQLGKLHCCPLWLQVLPDTSAAEGGPLVVACDVQLPEAGTAAVARTGVVRVCLSSFSETSPERVVLQAGPTEALLAANFGPPFAACCGVVTEPRAPAPLPARVLPLFVGSAGGVHCILSHEVVALALHNLRSLVAAPSRSGKGGSRSLWNGLTCLAMLGDGTLRMISLWEKEEAEKDSALPEEQRSYRLVASQVELEKPLPRSPTLLHMLGPGQSLPGMPFGSFICVGKGNNKLDIVLFGLERASSGFRSIQQLSTEVAQPNAPKDAGIAANVLTCAAAWPGFAFQHLCVALPGTSDGESSLQLWQLEAKSRQGETCSWRLTLEGHPEGELFPSSSWPLDSSLMRVENPEDTAHLAAVTSQSAGTTVLMRGRGECKQAKASWQQRIDGRSLMLRLFRQEHSTMIAQVSETSLVIYGAPPAWGEGSNERWKELHSEALQPFCSHAASCQGRRGELWIFTAAGPAVLKKEVTRQGRQLRVQPVGGKAFTQQVAALCCLEPTRNCPRPLLVASLWLSAEIVVLDADTLEEVCRYQHGLSSRLLSLHPIPADEELGVWSLLAGSANGHLLLLRRGGTGLYLQSAWRVARQPLHLLGLASGVMVRAASGEAFLIRPSNWKLEPLICPPLAAVCSGWGDSSVLALQRGDSTCHGPVEAKLTKEGAGHSVVRSVAIQGEVLALSFMPWSEPCIIALLQRLAPGARQLCLASFGPDLSLTSAVTLEEDRQLWPLGRLSAWLWDLGDASVLVAVGQPGLGSPPVVLHRIKLEPRPDYSWLGLPEPATAPAGRIISSFRPAAPVLVAAAPDAPVVIVSTDGLQFFCPHSLTELGKLPLADLGLRSRGGVTSLGLAHGRPASWKPIACAAAGASQYLFLGFTSGDPAVLRMRTRDNEAPNCSLLRLVLPPAKPRPPIVHVTPFEDPGSEMPCGFIAFDAAGVAFRLRLHFAGGPLEAPSVEVERCPSEELPPANNGSCAFGDFVPAAQGAAGPACVAVTQLNSGEWTTDVWSY